MISIFILKPLNKSMSSLLKSKLTLQNIVIAEKAQLEFACQLVQKFNVMVQENVWRKEED
jgi:hypothetical protein